MGQKIFQENNPVSVSVVTSETFLNKHVQCLLYYAVLWQTWERGVRVSGLEALEFRWCEKQSRNYGP